MSLQERTLVVRNFDSEKTTEKLLRELCIQGGPVRKVVVRSDHAFVEFEDIDSVGYTMALLDGVKLFGRPLAFEPKLRLKKYSRYTSALQEYINYDKQQRAMERQSRQHYQEQRQHQDGMNTQVHHYQMQGRPIQVQQPLPPYHQYPQHYPPQMYYQPHNGLLYPPQYFPSQPQPDFQGPQFQNYR